MVQATTETLQPTSIQVALAQAQKAATATMKLVETKLANQVLKAMTKAVTKVVTAMAVETKAMALSTEILLHHQYLSPLSRATRVAVQATIVTKQPTVTAMNNR